MKRLLKTLLLNLAAISVIWLLSWLLVSGWYSRNFGRPLVPVLNAAAVPAIITAVVCIIAEGVLELASAGVTVVVMLNFALRIMLMIILTIVVYVVGLYHKGSSDRAEVVSYLLMIMANYGALLLSHVSGSLIFDRGKKYF